jgi:hypothetical protein
MRITISQDFDSAEAAADFLARVGNPLVTINVEPGKVAASVPEVKTRKPRADAGKPREPYGPRDKNAEGAPGGTQPPAQAEALAPAGSGGGTLIKAEAAAPSAPVSSAPAEPASASQAPSGSRRLRPRAERATRNCRRPPPSAG